jgi:hypothetical protein
MLFIYFTATTLFGRPLFFFFKYMNVGELKIFARNINVDIAEDFEENSHFIFVICFRGKKKRSPNVLGRNNSRINEGIYL